MKFYFKLVCFAKTFRLIKLNNIWITFDYFRKDLEEDR